MVKKWKKMKITTKNEKKWGTMKKNEKNEKMKKNEEWTACNWKYIPISQWNTFEDSPYSHISVSQAYYILSKESLLWRWIWKNKWTHAFKCNHASHINKIRDTAIELGSRDSFQDMEFCPKQQR